MVKEVLGPSYVVGPNGPPGKAPNGEPAAQNDPVGSPAPSPSKPKISEPLKKTPNTVEAELFCTPTKVSSMLSYACTDGSEAIVSFKSARTVIKKEQPVAYPILGHWLNWAFAFCGSRAIA